MEKGALYRDLMERFALYKSKRETWLELANESFAMYNGNQWVDKDVESLRCRGRPALTFNHIMPLINAIIGSEINNRRRVRFIPREVGDIKANELLSSVASWFFEETNGEMVDTSIFKDSLISGMGWGEVTLDYSNSIDGEPCVRKLDPLKMVWDINATEPNLKDARYLFYETTLPIEDLKEMFPNAEESEFDIRESDKDDDLDGDYTNSYTKTVRNLGRIIEARYKVKESFVVFMDPLDGSEKTVLAKEFKDISNNFLDNFGIELEGIKYRKDVVRRAFLGATELLEEEDEPLSPDGEFGWLCITGYYDNLEKYYYGLIRSIKDSQVCINKFFSEAVHNYNMQGKGGFFVEKGAVDDLEGLAHSINMPDEITVVNPSGLNRILPKPVAQPNNALSSLLSFSMSQISNVSGVSQEFLGLREVNQPGILEAHRKQSSLNILAPLFDNFKLYKKFQGQIVLYLIQNYLSDGRLIRIVGNEKQQYIPLLKEEVSNREYDIIIDDEPLSLNDSERNFQVIMQLMPMIQSYLTPELMIQVMKFSPLPSSFTDSIQETVMKQQQSLQGSNQPNMSQELQQAEIGKMVAQANKDNSLANYHNKQAEDKSFKIAAEMQLNNLLTGAGI